MLSTATKLNSPTRHANGISSTPLRSNIIYLEAIMPVPFCPSAWPSCHHRLVHCHRCPMTDCLQEVIWKSTSIRLLLASSILKLVAMNIILRRRRVDIEFPLSVRMDFKHRGQVSTPVAVVRR